MTKRQKDKHQAYQTLSRHGLDFESFNYISPNAGLETAKHITAKALVCHVGINNDYWVASEVETPHGEIDALLWGHPERLTYAVEVETSPTEQVKRDKLERYVHQQDGIDDMMLINVTQMPTDMIQACEYVADELGLEP